jgi:signal transduction histidine kinase
VEFIDQSTRLLTESVEKIKKIAVALRPPQLDIIGLPDALREYVETIEKDSGLRIAFKAEVRQGDIPPAAAIALYRVAQEALNNVIKHARAKKAAVELTLDKGRLLFSVRDDGAGFETGPALRNPKSIGLIGMQERIESVHGQLRIRSEINKGTEVRVLLPLKSRPAP